MWCFTSLFLFTFIRYLYPGKTEIFLEKSLEFDSEIRLESLWLDPTSHFGEYWLPYKGMWAHCNCIIITSSCIFLYWLTLQHAMYFQIHWLSSAIHQSLGYFLFLWLGRSEKIGQDAKFAEKENQENVLLATIEKPTSRFCRRIKTNPNAV